MRGLPSLHTFFSIHRISRRKIDFRFSTPTPHVHVANYAPPCIPRLVSCQTRARRAKDRSRCSQESVCASTTVAGNARATLALWAYITRKRPIRQLSSFDLSAWRARADANRLEDGVRFRIRRSLSSPIIFASSSVISKIERHVGQFHNQSIFPICRFRAERQRDVSRAFFVGRARNAQLERSPRFTRRRRTPWTSSALFARNTFRAKHSPRAPICVSLARIRITSLKHVYHAQVLYFSPPWEIIFLIGYR